MKFSLMRAAAVAGLLAFAAGPLAAGAATLTPAQTSMLHSGTVSYFKALGSGDFDTLTAMTTKSFVITHNGKPLSPGKLSGQIQAAKLRFGSLTGSAHITSAAVQGGVLVEMVTLNANGQTMRGDTSQNVSGTTSHKLTWVKVPSGKWLLASDEILSASHS